MFTYSSAEVLFLSFNYILKTASTVKTTSGNPLRRENLVWIHKE